MILRGGLVEQDLLEAKFFKNKRVTQPVLMTTRFKTYDLRKRLFMEDFV